MKMKLPSSPRAPPSPSRISPFLLSAILVSVVIYLLVAFPINDFKLQEVFGGSSSACTSKAGRPTPPSSSSVQLVPGGADDTAVDVRVLIGVITVPSAYERRALLRLAYSLQPRPVRAVVDVRFVFCDVAKEEDRILVALEVIAHGDILVLNCTENMNDGKTYDYFAAVPRLFAGEHAYDYVGKTDDDTYYRLAALADSLRGKARRDAYHGLLIPCDGRPPTPTERGYMAGFGYIVSWDVAQWLSDTPELRGDRVQIEDMDFARWLKKGGRYKNVYAEQPRMYDYLDREMQGAGVTCYRHEHTADAVGVHKLKNRLQWARTLHFFNATQGLKPSNMYHLDLHNVYRV